MSQQMTQFYFLWLSNIPLYNITTSFFIQTSVDGHLGFFCVLAVINSAAMNTALRVSLGIMVLSGCMPSNEIAE